MQLTQNESIKNSYIHLYNKVFDVMHFKKDILHFPRLDTVLMVEKFIKNNSGEFKKRSLWENLPKKTMYQTYGVIFDYLLDSGKIGIDREGHVAWIWNPALVKKYVDRKDLAWRPSK